DGEAADPDRVTIVRQPSSGVLSFNANGDGYVYTSSTSFQGEDSFEYRVCTFEDADNCGVATAYIRVAEDLCADVECGPGVCDADTGSCICEEGYHDEGGVCVPDDLCEDVVCDANEVCDAGACVCDEGYSDNGVACTADVEITTPEDGTRTKDPTPTVTKTDKPDTTVVIIVDEEPVDEVEVDDDGNWTWTPEDDLEIGEHEI